MTWSTWLPKHPGETIRATTARRWHGLVYPETVLAERDRLRPGGSATGNGLKQRAVRKPALHPKRLGLEGWPGREAESVDHGALRKRLSLGRRTSSRSRQRQDPPPMSPTGEGRRTRQPRFPKSVHEDTLKFISSDAAIRDRHSASPSHGHGNSHGHDSEDVRQHSDWLTVLGTT